MTTGLHVVDDAAFLAHRGREYIIARDLEHLAVVELAQPENCVLWPTVDMNSPSAVSGCGLVGGHVGSEPAAVVFADGNSVTINLNTGTVMTSSPRFVDESHRLRRLSRGTFRGEELVVVVDDSGRVTAWRLPDFQARANVITDLGEYLNDFAIVPWGDRLFAIAARGGPDAEVVTWDLTSGRPVPGALGYREAAFAAQPIVRDGRLFLMTGTMTGVIRIHDFFTRREAYQPLRVPGAVYALRQTSKYELAAAVDEDLFVLKVVQALDKPL